ncbi:uncharacterized protein LOC143909203 [Arctopsyche grandis]|uniref:uncharacterized protein LOC143909203 n=1 Tax=Arctopsyche grandis TaxID=121162 RepID=UPI00406D99FF
MCSKVFAAKSIYVEYMNSHNGIKQHKCEICLSSFTHSSSLKRHISIPIHVSVTDPDSFFSSGSGFVFRLQIWISFSVPLRNPVSVLDPDSFFNSGSRLLIQFRIKEAAGFSPVSICCWRDLPSLIFMTKPTNQYPPPRKPTKNIVIFELSGSNIVNPFNATYADRRCANKPISLKYAYRSVDGRMMKVHITKKNTRIRDAISPEERITVTLRYLATGMNFTTLSQDFLIGRSTVAEIIKETCAALWEVLQPVEMPEPTKDSWQTVAEQFYIKTNFPNCIGAVDVADSNLCFLTIDVGSCDKETDSNIFRNSNFGKKLYGGMSDLPFDRKLLDTTGPVQPFVLLGDEAFAT